MRNNIRRRKGNNKPKKYQTLTIVNLIQVANEIVGYRIVDEQHNTRDFTEDELLDVGKKYEFSNARTTKTKVVITGQTEGIIALTATNIKPRLFGTKYAHLVSEHAVIGSIYFDNRLVGYRTIHVPTGNIVDILREHIVSFISKAGLSNAKVVNKQGQPHLVGLNGASVQNLERINSMESGLKSYFVRLQQIDQLMNKFKITGVVVLNNKAEAYILEYVPTNVTDQNMVKTPEYALTVLDTMTLTDSNCITNCKQITANPQFPLAIVGKINTLEIDKSNQINYMDLSKLIGLYATKYTNADGKYVNKPAVGEMVAITKPKIRRNSIESIRSKFYLQDYNNGEKYIVNLEVLEKTLSIMDADTGRSVRKLMNSINGLFMENPNGPGAIPEKTDKNNNVVAPIQLLTMITTLIRPVPIELQLDRIVAYYKAKPSNISNKLSIATYEIAKDKQCYLAGFSEKECLISIGNGAIYTLLPPELVII